MSVNVTDNSTSVLPEFCRNLELGAEYCVDPSAPACCFAHIPRSFAVSAAVLCFLVTVAGTIGNLLTLMAIPYARSRCVDPNSPLHNPMTLLVVNLSASDLLYSVLNMPAFAMEYLNAGWAYGPKLCWASALARHVPMFSSFMSVGLIALHRCLALWWPPAGRILFASLHTVPAVLFTWMYALALCMPLVLEVNGKLGYNYEMGQCDAVPVSGHNFHGPAVLTAICLPLSMMLLCSALIVAKVRGSRTRLGRFSIQSTTTSNQLWRRELRLCGLVALLVAAYLICVTPTAVLKLLGGGQPVSALHVVVFFIYWSHFVVNICIYSLRNGVYRRAYLVFFGDARKLFVRGGLKLASSLRGPSLRSNSTNTTTTTTSIYTITTAASSAIT